MVDLGSSPAVFTILSALVEERTGLHYGLSDRELFLERVTTRATDAGFDSLLDYYYFLRYDPVANVELRLLTEALVVNESFFFREIEALRVAVNQFIRPLMVSGRRPRIWSSACATGEEPLTLAMLLADADLLDNVEIVASDISARALARAREGRYPPRAVREGFDAGLVERWLTPLAQGRWQVDQRLVEAIAWSRVNLTNIGEVACLGRFDVILCRNVLIYFRPETVTRVLSSLATALKPEAVLFVGISESLMRFGTLLACEERDRVFFYRRSE